MPCHLIALYFPIGDIGCARRPRPEYASSLTHSLSKTTKHSPPPELFFDASRSLFMGWCCEKRIGAGMPAQEITINTLEFSK